MTALDHNLRLQKFLAQTRASTHAKDSLRYPRHRNGGVATVGAAGVEVAQEVLAEAQSTVLPLEPYLDTLRWLFIALALGGIAVVV